MAVDNANIMKIMDLIQEEENTLSEKQSSLSAIRRALDEICITQYEKENTKGGYDMVDREIQDRLLIQKMTDVRRQAIYDRCIKLWTDYKTPAV